MKNYDDDTMHDLLAAYALGTLETDEARQVEAYLETSDTARAELQEFREIVELLPHSIRPVEPPAHVRRQLFARIEAGSATTPAHPTPVPQTSTYRPGPIRRFAVPAVLAVLLLMIIAVGQLVFELRGRVQSLAQANQTLVSTLDATDTQLAQVQRELAQTQQELSQSQRQLDMINQQLMTEEEVFTFVTAPGVAVRQLDPAAAADTSGAMYMRPGHTRAVILFRGLSPLAPGRVYQFWLANGSVQFAIGTVSIDADGLGRLVIDAPADVNAFSDAMLTIETEPGKRQPSDEVVLAGSL